MPTMIFVNLPVKDLARSRTFYTGLGYTVNEQFSDENAICVIISDTIYAMLLTEEYFATFTPKTVADATAVTEAINALSADSREDVDAFVERALGVGGTETREASDLGFMYGRSIQDPDGHIWEILWMDPSVPE